MLIILFSANSFAQLSPRDSLLLLIANETNDTIRIKLLIQCGIFHSENLEDLMGCLKEVYELSKKTNFRPGLVYNHYYEGQLLAKEGKYDEAIDKFKSSVEAMDSINLIQGISWQPLSDIRGLFYLADRQEDKFQYYTDKLIYYKNNGPIENTADCYFGIAGYYGRLADYDKAIEYYMRAQEVYRTFDPIDYNNEQQVIGSQYLLWGNLDKAEEYLKSALSEQLSSNLDCFFSYHQLGNLYLKKHDYRQALQYYFKGRQYLRKGRADFQAINLINFAAAYLEMNFIDSARYYLDSADRVRQKEKMGLVYSYGNVDIDYIYYRYYIATGKENLALQSLKSALQEAQSARFVPLVLKYTNELHAFLLKSGDSLQALRYLIKGQAIQDSLSAMSTKARIASYEIEQQQQQKENEIQQLQTQKTSQRKYYLVTGAFLLLIVAAVISRLRYKRKRDQEQLKTEFNKQLAQAETKALRAQMNPHFIFNCLNSINSYVIDQKHETASDYLIKFSKLIRLILDNSRSETIAIEKELETLRLYVLLESARFDNKFACVYTIAEDVNTSTIMIPPMLLQPFVENAIWHGLMQKEDQGTIIIEIKKADEEFLNISIIDDGIGREKASELKSKTATHKSHGLKVTSQRIEMMNKLNSTGAKVHIFDLKDDQGNATGTKVELIIPI
jgi:tetratricopeptide (TPR) repeat protein